MEENTMAFWNLHELELQDFRPGIKSAAHLGQNLIMACMEIGPGKEDPGHEHPFDQCGIVLAGELEMWVEEERMVMRPNQAYFIPSGARHGWKTLDAPVRILDVSSKKG
jgi:quercetin dioxygenase-like cupin family protein